MKFLSILFSCLAMIAVANFETGCASDGSLTPQAQAGLTAAEKIGWQAIDVLETINTDTGGVLTTAGINYALQQTHNTGDTAVVNAVFAAGNKVIAAQAAAHVQTPKANAAIATAVLADPATLAVAAQAVAQTPLPLASTPTNS